MKKIKSHLWKGALCLLAAAFIVTLLLSGHGLRLHEPEPLASQTASIRPEGQGAEPIEDSSEPEETEPTEPTEPSDPTEPTTPKDPDTSDSNSVLGMIAFIALAIVSLACAAVVFIRRKRA